jgi:hypothetical protein
MRLLLFLLAAVPLLATTTTVTQAVVNPDGTPATGTVYILASAACQSGSDYVGSTTVPVAFSNGSFTASLVPNDTCGGTTYTASWVLSGGATWVQIWSVPTSATPVTVASVVVGSQAVPSWITQWFSQNGPAPTTVAQTILNPDGSPASGQAIVALNAACTSGSQYVAEKTIIRKFVAGAFSMHLMPNDTCVPQGTSYSVSWTMAGGRTWTETWVVPTSGSPVAVSSVVQRTNLPAPPEQLPPSQIAQAGAASGQVLGWNGSVWAPATRAAGPAGPTGPQGPVGPTGSQGPAGPGLSGGVAGAMATWTGASSIGPSTVISTDEVNKVATLVGQNGLQFGFDTTGTLLTGMFGSGQQAWFQAPADAIDLTHNKDFELQFRDGAGTPTSAIGYPGQGAGLGAPWVLSGFSFQNVKGGVLAVVWAETYDAMESPGNGTQAFYTSASTNPNFPDIVQIYYYIRRVSGTGSTTGTVVIGWNDGTAQSVTIGPLNLATAGAYLSGSLVTMVPQHQTITKTETVTGNGTMDVFIYYTPLK